MTLITKTDVENELQVTLDAGYTDSIISDIADTEEDLLKLHTRRSSFSGSTASLAKKAVLYLTIDRLVTSDRNIVKNAVAEISENSSKIKFTNGKTLESYRHEATAIIERLRIGSGRITGMYTFSDTGEDQEIY